MNTRREDLITRIEFGEKIKPAKELATVLAELKTEGKRIVQCHGAFDLLHRGHLHQFQQARSQGDVLVVTLTTDRFVAKGPGRPVFNQQIRAEMVAAISLVDFVTFSDEASCVEVIKALKPDVYVKGRSYEDSDRDLSGKILLEKNAVESVGGQIYFSHEMPIRSTPLINSFIDPYPEQVLEYLNRMKARYSFDEVVKTVDAFRSLKVLVIGEAIIDQYDYVMPMDTSPKGGVIAMRHLDSEMFAGGSLACANHIANFCSEVALVSCLGSIDSHEEIIRSSLAPNVRPWFLTKEDARTIVKKRQVDTSYFKKHSETYLFDDRILNGEEEECLLNYLETRLGLFDLIFVIDYGHGFITDRAIDLMTTRADRLAVNAQTNSANKGFNLITKYPKAKFVCLDHYEIRLAMCDKISDPPVLAERLLADSQASVVAVTLGHNGSVIVDNTMAHETPVFSKKVVDTVGAGDAFFSIASLCVASGVPLDLTGLMGNVAGGLATTYIGNKTSIDKTMLFNFVRTLLG